jgi:hypothetical protein
MIANHKMTVLRNNQNPKGLVPLEKLFDKNDVTDKSTIHPKTKEVEYCNILSEQETMNISQNFCLPIIRPGMLIF